MDIGSIPQSFVKTHQDDQKSISPSHNKKIKATHHQQSKIHGTDSLSRNNSMLPAKDITTNRRTRALTRQEKIDSIKSELFIKNALHHSPDESEQIIKTWHSKVLALANPEDFPPPGHYVLATCLWMQNMDLDIAKRHCDAAIAGANENSLIYVKSLFLRVGIYIAMHNFIDSQCCTDCFSALAKGDPEAAIYCMVIKMGMFAQPSLIKWADLSGVIDLARKIPEFQAKMTRRLAEEHVRIRFSDNQFDILANEVMRCLDNTANNYPDYSLFLFARRLCDLFTSQDDQRQPIDNDIKDLFAAKGNGAWQGNAPEAIYLYTQLVRYGMDVTILQKLISIRQEASNLLAAKALMTIAQETSTAIYLLNQITSIPAAYLLRYEIHLKAGNFKSAYRAILDGIAQINDFLNGKKTIYGHLLGAQAGNLVAYYKNNGYEHDIETITDIINQNKLDDLSSAHQLLRNFQIRADILMDILKEERAKEKKPPQSIKYTNDRSITDNESGTDNPTQCSKSTAISLPPPPTTRSKLEHTSHPVVSAPWTLAPLPCNQSTLNRINNLMTHQAEFDQAEAMLRAFKAEPESLLWFRRQQSLCWCFIEQSSAFDYLSGKVSNGQQPKELALEKLKGAERLAKDTIRTLVKLAEKSGMTLPKDEGVGRVFAGENRGKCAEVSNALEPAMQSVYGGLYSTLGHIEKAYRDNPLCFKSAHDHVKRAIEYFQIANRIRGILG